MLLLKATNESLQVTTGLPATATFPTRKGYISINNNVSTTLFVMSPDSTISPGDWMIIVVDSFTGAGGPVITDPPGWTVLQPSTTTGTQMTSIYAKNRVAGETTYNVNISLGGNSTTVGLMWGSGAAPISSWIIGANMLRPNNVPPNTSTNVAPSITTTVPNTLSLIISTERTNALESNIIGMSNATPWFFSAQNGTSNIQTLSVGFINKLTSGTTGDVIITYPNAQTSNGMAIQIGIPPASGSLSLSASYTDSSSTGAVYSSNETIISTATTTTVMTAPGTSTTRLVKLISMTNTDPYVSNTVLFQKNIGGVFYNITPTFTLAAGEMVEYMDAIGWTYYAANGTIKANQSLPITTNTQLQYNVSGTLNKSLSPTLVNVWSPGGSPAKNWTYLASSADGVKLAAIVNSEYVYTSPDSGVTWTQRTAPGTADWQGIASSADGTKLVITAKSSGYVWTSTDSGISWTKQTSAGANGWYIVSSSADGTKLATSMYGLDYIYTSTDSGITWTQQPNSNYPDWLVIAMSADGIKLAVVSYSHRIWTSPDAGVSWYEQFGTDPRNWLSIASSADGTKLVAGVDSGYLYTSTDMGVTWIERSSSGIQSWQSVASSADGTKLVASAYGDYLYISSDSGATWTRQPGTYGRGWFTVTISSDGTKISAIDSNNGYIYTSNIVTIPNSVPTWTKASGNASNTLLLPNGNSILALSAWTNDPVALSLGANTLLLLARNTASSINPAIIDGPANYYLDDFSSTFNTSYWSTNYGTISINSGRLRLSCINTYTGATTAAIYDLNTYSILVDMMTLPNAGNGGTQTYLGIVGGSNTAQFLFTGNPLVLTLQLTGTTTVVIPYDLMNHRSLRFRLNNGILIWEVSADRVLWTVVRSEVAPAWITGSLVAVNLNCGYFGTETSPGYAEFDNYMVQYVPPATQLQTAQWQNQFSLWTPRPTASGTWLNATGNIAGTGVSVLPTTTNTYTAMVRTTTASIVTNTNQQVGLRGDQAFMRGNSKSIGGFFFSCRFGFDSIKIGMRGFVGMSVASTMVVADPSTIANMCGFGFDLADNAWVFMHNGPTVTASKELIPGQGTLATNNTGYDAYIWCAPGGSRMYYRLDRTDTGATLVDSWVDTNLPLNTTLLFPLCYMSNGTANINAGDATLGINRMYIETIR